MRRAAVLVLAAAGALVPAPARAQLGTHDVQVRNNFYTPQAIRIARGDTVRWTTVDSGHTVTAKDGRFATPLLNQGDVFEYTFDDADDETVTYFCQVHEGAMFGVVTVGEGSPPPPPGEPPDVRDVPAEFPTIAAAIAGAEPGTLVQLAPGSYNEDVQITVPGLILRGMGPEPDDVVIDGTGLGLPGLPSSGVGIAIVASGARIENLRVTNHQQAGIFAGGVDGWAVDGVALDGNGAFGLRAEAAPGGAITDSAATGHARAGFSIAGCVACDTTARAVTATGNLYGFHAYNAGGVVVRDSTFTGNGTGIALRSAFVTTAGEQAGAPQRGAHVLGNTIEDNTSTAIAPPPLDDAMELRTGAGVWIDGGWHDVVEGNAIEGHTYGIVVSGLRGPSVDVRVVRNQIAGSSQADLAWDGLGLNVCFEANGEATTQPPEAQTLYACALPATAGVPFPLVDVTLLQTATI